MINSLLKRKNLAKTSSTPGKTRRVDYFNINDKLFFADLPGYGYASVPRSLRARWGRFIENYLETNPFLQLVVVLLDVRRGMTEADSQLVEWLVYNDLNLQIVITKCDKVSKNESQKIRTMIRQNTTIVNEPILFSAVKNLGKQEIWAAILSACSIKL